MRISEVNKTEKIRDYKIHVIVFFSIVVFCGCHPENRDSWQQIFLKSDVQNLYLYKSNAPYLQDSVLPLTFSFNPVDVVSEKKFQVYNALSLGKQLKEYILETPQKAIYFFLFDRSVIESVPWDSIRTKNLYLRKYAIHESDVDNANDFTLYY